MRRVSRGKFKNLAPVVNLVKSVAVWSTLQADAFSVRLGKQVFHSIFYVGEASGCAVDLSTLRHGEDERRNISTDQFLRSLRVRWAQYFGCPEVLKIDLEGAFRGLDLRRWCATRGVRIEHAPVEHHQSIADVERGIGFLRHKVEVFLRHEPDDPAVVSAAMVGAHNWQRCTAIWPFFRKGWGASCTGYDVHSRHGHGLECLSRVETSC